MKTNVILFLLVFPFYGLTQQYTVSGYVKDAQSSELLPGALVMVEGTSIGVVSNSYGFYSITLERGEYNLKASYLGYIDAKSSLFIDANQTIDLLLEVNSSEIESVVIDSSEESQLDTPQMSSHKISMEAVKDLPAILGEKDVIKTLQLLPGVQSGGEGQTGFYVRGGGPDQNLILLDEAPVYNANHLFGFFSLFNGDAIKSVELIKGGFPAKYGGRLSSVVDMTAKEGNRDHLTGKVNLGLISASGVVEGPLSKNKKSSYMVSGRRTYADLFMRPISQSQSDGNEKVGYFFYDMIAKANVDLNDKNRLFVSGYFGRDKFSADFKDEEDTGQSDLIWGNETGTLRWNHLFSPKVFGNASLIFSEYDLGISSKEKNNNQKYQFSYNSSIQDVGLKYDLDIFPNNDHAIKTGVQVTQHQFKPRVLATLDEQSNTNSKEQEKYEALESAFYIQDEWFISDRLKTNLGLRLSHYVENKKSYFKPEPRISASYALNDATTVKASYAEMNQYIHLLSSTGAGLPTDLWVPSTDEVSPQFSRQYAFGLAREFYEKDFSISVEGYYKEMDDIIAYKEGASFADIESIGEGNGTTTNWQKNVTSGSGTSYGAEFLLEKKKGNLHGWLGYTWSKTQHEFQELNDGKAFSPRYDRRNDLSIVSMYDLKKNNTLSAVWVYGTGQAITLPEQKVYGGTHSDFRNLLSNRTVTSYGGRNAHRMENYHRLDLAYQMNKERKRGERTWEVGVYNAYNRANPYFYYLDNESTGNQEQYKLKNVSIFQVIPSISWSFKFK